MRTTVLLVGVATVLLFAESGQAKVTCQQRGSSPDGIALRGLPARPVVGRTYRLAAVVSHRGPNPTPYLGVQYCGEHGEGVVAETDGWFRESARQAGTFFADLRFSRPGPWALSFMDLGGTFHDLGIRRVTASGTEPQAAVGFADRLTLVWFAAQPAWLMIQLGEAR